MLWIGPSRSRRCCGRRHGAVGPASAGRASSCPATLRRRDGSCSIRAGRAGAQTEGALPALCARLPSGGRAGANRVSPADRPRLRPTAGAASVHHDRSRAPRAMRTSTCSRAGPRKQGARSRQSCCLRFLRRKLPSLRSLDAGVMLQAVRQHYRVAEQYGGVWRVLALAGGSRRLNPRSARPRAARRARWWWRGGRHYRSRPARCGYSKNDRTQLRALAILLHDQRSLRERGRQRLRRDRPRRYAVLPGSCQAPDRRRRAGRAAWRG